MARGSPPRSGARGPPPPSRRRPRRSGVASRRASRRRSRCRGPRAGRSRSGPTTSDRDRHRGAPPRHRRAGRVRRRGRAPSDARGHRRPRPRGQARRHPRAHQAGADRLCPPCPPSARRRRTAWSSCGGARPSRWASSRPQSPEAVEALMGALIDPDAVVVDNAAHGLMGIGQPRRRRRSRRPSASPDDGLRQMAVLTLSGGIRFGRFRDVGTGHGVRADHGPGRPRRGHPRRGRPARSPTSGASARAALPALDTHGGQRSRGLRARDGAPSHREPSASRRAFGAGPAAGAVP